ncbi:MAG: hypothetical protein KC422_23545, partial [Trueperaceae bacterium]|nr:hypothetical protein [Trueperaceae bacterium]
MLALIACGGAAETDLPNPPSSVTAVPTTNAIKLSWKYSGNIATGFVIYREELASSSLQLTALSKLAEVGAGARDYVDTTVDVNKTYRYSVTAKNDKGENPSDPSKNQTSAVQATPSDGFRLSIIRTGSGAGTITSTPAGIDCNYETGSGCDFVFTDGAKVILAVTPNADSKFNGWRDVEGCTGTEPCTITMDANKNIPVDLLRTGITISVDPSIGTGKGKVTSSPEGIDCGTSCSFSTSVTPFTLVLAAAADATTNSSFVEWQGCPKVEGGNGQFCRVTQDSPGSVKIGAKFNLPAPSVTTFASDKAKIAEGASATLSWDVATAGNTDVSLVLTALPAGSTEPQAIDISAKTLKDSLSVQPSVSTTYTLVAKSASGDSEAKKVIVSIGDATTISLSATDTNPADATPDIIDVTPTDKVKLSWAVAGESPFTLSMTKTSGASTTPVSLVGKGETDSVDDVTGATATYTLTAINALGVTSTASLTVEVGAAPVVSSFVIDGGDDTVTSGSTVKLDWTITSAAEVTAQTLTENAAPIAVAAATRTLSKVLSSPTDIPLTFTYELTATNRFGSSAKKELKLSVGKPAAITSFSAEDTSILINSLVSPVSPVKLNWSASGSEPLTFRIRRGLTEVATLNAGERTTTVPGVVAPMDITYFIVADNAYG